MCSCVASMGGVLLCVVRPSKGMRKHSASRVFTRVRAHVVVCVCVFVCVCATMSMHARTHAHKYTHDCLQHFVACAQTNRGKFQTCSTTSRTLSSCGSTRTSSTAPSPLASPPQSGSDPYVPHNTYESFIPANPEPNPSALNPEPHTLNPNPFWVLQAVNS